jgi:hypothetical protein
MAYSKGKTIHRTKRTALKVARACREENIPCKITKVKGGYRVDKDWS